MDTQAIIAALEAKRDRLSQAITALQPGGKTSGRPGRRGPRHMSAAARNRISAAQKKRWAERKRKEAA